MNTEGVKSCSSSISPPDRVLVRSPVLSATTWGVRETVRNGLSGPTGSRVLAIRRQVWAEIASKRNGREGPWSA